MSCTDTIQRGVLDTRPTRVKWKSPVVHGRRTHRVADLLTAFSTDIVDVLTSVATRKTGPISVATLADRVTSLS